MAIPTITPLPTAMSRNEPEVFDERGDAYFAALEKKFVGEMNDTIDATNEAAEVVDTSTTAALIAAQNANAAQQSASQVAGATAWVSGTTYAKNVCAISQINFQTYRRKVAGAGTTDPMNDPTNWALLVSAGSFIPVAQTSTTFDLSTGNYFKRTVTTNETWTFTNIPQDGYSWTVEVEHTGGAITLPASVKTPNNLVYTLNTGKSHLFMFVTSNKGTRIRMAAANNYDT